jgi:hypothetical protein
MSLMNHAALFPNLRVFVEVFKASMASMREFMIILTTMLVSFTWFFYTLGIEQPELLLEDYDLNEPDISRIPSFFEQIKGSIFVSFGDFGSSEGYDEIPWIMFGLLIIVITLVMMNLLIAIVSDAYCEIMENIQCASNSILTDKIHELEIFMFLNRSKEKRGYLLFAQEFKDDNDDSIEDLVSQMEENLVKKND